MSSLTDHSGIHRQEHQKLSVARQRADIGPVSVFSVFVEANPKQTYTTRTSTALTWSFVCGFRVRTAVV